ncbi:MAG: hypothetical protein RLY87_160 [Chloroflexota bacterium]|jgi:hypothetical protein
MANPPAKTPRTQQSVWLMLGGALLVSVFGWAAIVRQTEGPSEVDAPPVQLTVVELPASPNAARGVVAQAPQPANTTAAAPLRRVTRPVMRSRSSN